MNDEQKLLLKKLCEECAEVIQAYFKADQFGWDTIYINGKTKLESFQQEVGDVIATVIIISNKYPEILNEKILDAAVRKKITKLKKYIPSLADFDLDQAGVENDNQDSTRT